MNAALPFTVGWELEFALRDPNDLRQVHRAVSNAGYSAVNYGRYRRTPPSTEAWDLKTDASCGFNPGEVGFEAVSPVISSYPELVRHASVASIIQHSGGVVNERCGFHVHLGFQDYYEAENVDLLFRFLHRYEDAFFSMVPPRRRANPFCKPIPETVVETIHRRKGAVDLPGIWRDKNTWVNCVTLGRIGTIEFRLMPGTLNKDNIVGYVMFLQHVMETIIRGKKEVNWGKGSARDAKMLFLTMLQQGGFYGKDVIDPDRAALGRKWAQAQFKWANSPAAAAPAPRPERPPVAAFHPPATPIPRRLPTRSRRSAPNVNTIPDDTAVPTRPSLTPSERELLRQVQRGPENPVDPVIPAPVIPAPPTQRLVGGMDTFSIFDDNPNDVGVE